MEEILLKEKDVEIKHVVTVVCEETPGLADTEQSEFFLQSAKAVHAITTRLSDGDSIPKCETSLLIFPVPEHEVEQKKKEAKKAIKKKIKHFKKKNSGEFLFVALYPDT